MRLMLWPHEALIPMYFLADTGTVAHPSGTQTTKMVAILPQVVALSFAVPLLALSMPPFSGDNIPVVHLRT